MLCIKKSSRAHAAAPPFQIEPASLCFDLVLLFSPFRWRGRYRISGYAQETKPVWHFFDLKSYCIMIFMMGGGIWLRASGLVPATFIAVFYTGLGCALALAGVLFWVAFVQFDQTAPSD